ncbi:MULTISPECIES: hypothetical protein [unclassified Paenibacillus]|uniref:hypothetical protein n=1 Tax=unclassified Paenibacillus TaxID=185978 RepID=UPI001AE8D5B7|nr:MULTISPECIES: hypothetical protein [unclassified Paenibacillus]MBP1154244.1 hypothetical protein [Paenibacillus sp. PvP091]MBP1170371.1 hypothetical protein [Paenibacillus sp. PvR098]MBP2441399.1 hypothetical protein [Paenibacillus sp. PvP052]
MAEHATTALYLLKFLFSYFLLFYIIPSLVVPLDEDHKGKLDRWVISMIHSHFFIILIVHLFALSKLYETISLYVAVAIAFTLLAKRKIKSGEVTLGRKQLVRLLDLTDNRDELKRKLLAKWMETKGDMRSGFKQGLQVFLSSPIAWAGTILSLVLCGYVRFGHSIEHAYYGASDPYVHLKWVKALSANILYIDGVYPYGFEAVIAALNKFYLLDPYYIVRFIGPLAGVLILITLYYVLRKYDPNDMMAIFVTMAIIAASSWLFGGYLWRQMSALSMEYGILFFFPGIHFLIEYFRKGRPASLFLAAECMVLTLFIHPYVAVCTGAAYIVVFLFHADKVIRSGSFLKLVIIFLLAGGIGVMPLVLGVLSGLEFHETSIDFVRDSVNLGGDEFRTWSKLWEGYSTNHFILVFLVSIGVLGILVVAGMLLRFLHRGSVLLTSDWRMNSVYLLLGLLFFGMYQADHLGLPVFIPEYRLEIFFIIVAAVVIARTLSQIVAFIQNRFVSEAIKLVASVLILMFFFSNAGYALPLGNRYQYEEAVQAYIKIRNEFPHQEWTIISPIEEYPMVLGYGWHTNLWEFAKGITEKDEKAGSFPTNYVFLFVEKIPLDTNREVTEEDAEQPFPANVGARLDDYYRIKENRIAIQARAYYWAEAYRKTNSHMQIFSDSPNMRVYLITQDGNNPYNLLK